MGKSKRKTRLSSLRHQSWPVLPTGAALVGDNGSDDGIPVPVIGREVVADIRDKLRSHRPADRHLALDMMCQSMANFDDTPDKDISELIRTVSPMCADRAEKCRLGAADCLWYICVDNHALRHVDVMYKRCYLSSLSDRMCDLMISADVMTPLMAAFNQYFSAPDWLASSVGPKAHLSAQLKPQIYVNLCRLLTNLCGTSDKALHLFNASNVWQILVTGMKSWDVDSEVAIASAQCLSVAAEENPIPGLKSAENIDFIRDLCLKSPLNSSQMHLSVLTATMAHDMDVVASGAVTMEQVFTLIDTTLSAQCLPQMRELAVNIQQFVDNEKDIDFLRQNYLNVKNAVLAKRVALELVTNMTGADTGTGSSDEGEGMDCDDEDMEASDADDMDSNVGDENDVKPFESTISEELEVIILGKGLLAKIGDHLCPVDDELRDQLMRHSFGAEIVNCIQSIQLCALICVHNLVDCISPAKLPISEQLWKYIYNTVFDNNPGADTDPLVEEATNTIRALIARTPGVAISADDLQKLCIYCQKSGSVGVKCNVINVMSVCGQRSQDMEFVERVAGMLLQGLESERDLRLRAELLDALIDIFSEDLRTDAVALRLDLINRMKGPAVLFRKEVCICVGGGYACLSIGDRRPKHR
ncbi:unnamed protein product [Oppiella nova]|uniref:SYO1-like TPR repeats domain-containing protein n=1 Tax=Oppiella nova TaxID=334625 RepID=A0A7R9M8M8_9ACAR|nr:unnamed protein product [Oppiella nova]CAG2172249.1 unnamed protein product [Oppiella nova]